MSLPNSKKPGLRSSSSSAPGSLPVTSLPPPQQATLSDRAYRGRVAKSTLAAAFTLAVSGLLVGGSIMFYTLVRTLEYQRLETGYAKSIALAQQMKNEGNFAGCDKEAQQVPRQFRSYNQARDIIRDCQKSIAQTQLNQAVQLQDQGDFENAIKLASTTLLLLPEAQALIDEMAVQLLKAGRKRYQEERSSLYLNNALFPLRAIPASSSHYNEARSMIQQWIDEDRVNRDRRQAAQAALVQKDLEAARQAVELFPAQPFWRAEAEAINQQIEAVRQEMEASAQWQMVKQFMANKEWQNAIDAAMQLPDIYPWEERKANIIHEAQANLQSQKFCQKLRQATLGIWPQCS